MMRPGFNCGGVLLLGACNLPCFVWIDRLLES